jgi:hypothetical protein
MVEAPVHVSLTHDRLKELHNCDLDNGGRIILVGDVHGCADELDLLLKHVGFRKGGGDLVILLGDVVNKGPKSVEAVRLARSVGVSVLKIMRPQISNDDQHDIDQPYFILSYY